MSIMKGNISLLNDELNQNMTAAVLPLTIFIGVEAVVGLFGNILILLIYWKRYKQSNFRYIVLSLAVVDLTSCCTVLPGEIFSQLNWYNYKYDWVCKLKSYFNVFTAWASASILLILAFDRYRKICRPLSWQIQPSVALHVCGISFILSSFVSIPVTIFWGKQTYIYEVNGANVTVSVCEKADQFANGIYPLVYIGSVYMLPVSLMIFVAGTLNFLTAKTLFGQSTIEMRTRRLSISATTLTSVSFDRDLNGAEGKATSGDKNILEQSNGSIQQQTDPNVNILQQSNGNIQQQTDPNVNILTQSNGSLQHQTGVQYSRTTKNLPCEFSRSLRLTTIHETSNQTVFNRHGTSNVFNKEIDNSEIFCASVDTENGNASFSRNNGNNCFNNKGDELPNCTSDNSNECQNVKSQPNSQLKTIKSSFHRKQKTVIMLVLTAVFVFTMSTYVILTSFVAKSDGILKILSNEQKVVFFFFWRLYFMNSVINPILYGFMDPRFRTGLFSFIPGYKVKRRKGTKATQSTFLPVSDIKI